MKNIIEEYKKELKELISSKKYLFSIIIVSILAYGFAITHCSIGMDDTALDRYYGEFFSKNMIAAGRWGSYFLYKLLNLTSFTPFWLDLLTVLIIVSTAILISSFIRRNIRKNDIVLSLIFSCLYISYSLINEPFIFQASNLALFLGNLLTFAVLFAIYEIVYNHLKFRYYLPLIVIFAFSISLYEACCQTFLVGLLMCIMIRIIKYKEKDKDVLKFFGIGISILIVSIFLNYTILYLLYFIGIKNELSGGRTIYWFKNGLETGINIIIGNIKFYIFSKTMYFPVLEFIIAGIIGLIISIMSSIKRKNIMIFNVYILMLFSNIALSILQCIAILYRTCTSWGLMVAAIFTVSYYILSKKKYVKPIAIILITLLILWQTKDMNQWFYSDYVKSQRDLKQAYQIAEDIKKKANDLTKPIVFAGEPDQGFQLRPQIGAQSNGLSVIWWANFSFDDNSYELIKFINSLGYYFKRPTDEQYERGRELAEDMESYPKENYIKEFEDIIVVKL